MCILVSAMTILVFVAFSIVNLVLPFCNWTGRSHVYSKAAHGRNHSLVHIDKGTGQKSKQASKHHL